MGSLERVIDRELKTFRESKPNYSKIAKEMGIPVSTLWRTVEGCTEKLNSKVIFKLEEYNHINILNRWEIK